MDSKENRIVIIKLFVSEKLAPYIEKDLNVLKKTMYDIVKRYKEATAEDMPRSARPITATTPKNQNKLKRRIHRNPAEFMGKLAKKIKIGLSPMHFARCHYPAEPKSLQRQTLDIPTRMGTGTFSTLCNTFLQKQRNRRVGSVCGLRNRLT
ncbi:hypothetical protein ABEB36_003832 [Hypothenemus hampei]|uniref:Uncharacterized protein n=1 Tax=Hypothenemus hampei TaxID=57062 RepID=A0ABD1F1B6_HYPHA